MNNAARKILCDIVARYGPPAEEHAARYAALLRDFCHPHAAELFVLLSALDQRAVWELQNNRSSLPWPVLQARLTRNLQDVLALEESAAQWAVESWALALKIITPKDCCKLQPILAFIPPKPLPQGPAPDAERQMREAVQLALNDGVLDSDELARLRGLRRLLNLPRYAASRIYFEVKAERARQSRRVAMQAWLRPIEWAAWLLQTLTLGFWRGAVASAQWLVPVVGRLLAPAFVIALFALPAWLVVSSWPDIKKMSEPYTAPNTPRFTPPISPVAQPHIPYTPPVKPYIPPTPPPRPYVPPVQPYIPLARPYVPPPQPIYTPPPQPAYTPPRTYTPPPPQPYIPPPTPPRTYTPPTPRVR